MSALDAFRLDGRVVVLTGGGTGLGAAGARALASAGAHVVLLGRSPGALADTASQIAVNGLGSASWRQLDVADAEAVVRVMGDLAEEFDHLDVLVNNAAQAHQADVADVSTADWDRILDVNLRGPFLCSREFVRVSSAQEPRAIVNISSLAGVVGVRGQVAYSSSKAGVIGLTRALAVELASQGVRVNALAPGYFRTSMPGEVLADERATQSLLRRVPQRRIPEPDEIGPALVFLASDASRFMTGAILHFDGGYTAQ